MQWIFIYWHWTLFIFVVKLMSHWCFNLCTWACVVSLFQCLMGITGVHDLLGFWLMTPHYLSSICGSDDLSISFLTSCHSVAYIIQIRPMGMIWEDSWHSILLLISLKYKSLYSIFDLTWAAFSFYTFFSLPIPVLRAFLRTFWGSKLNKQKHIYISENICVHKCVIWRTIMPEIICRLIRLMGLGQYWNVIRVESEDAVMVLCSESGNGLFTFVPVILTVIQKNPFKYFLEESFIIVKWL